MRQCTCKVVANVYGDGFGKSLGPGLVVDLDEVIGQTADGTDAVLADHVNEDWFEAVDAEEPFIPPAAVDETNDEDEV